MASLFCLPKSPLSRASASGGFLSLRRESSCGLDNSICWSKAGSSSPWGEEPRKAVGVEDWVARGCCCCCCGGGIGCGCCGGGGCWGDSGACCCGLMAPRWLVEEEVPGTVMERKSIWGRPKEDRRQRTKGWEVCIYNSSYIVYVFLYILLLCPKCRTFFLINTFVSLCTICTYFLHIFKDLSWFKKTGPPLPTLVYLTYLDKDQKYWFDECIWMLRM